MVRPAGHACAKLVRLGQHHHDGDDLMRRCVKRNTAAAYAQPDFVQRVLISPGTLRGREWGGHMPDACSRLRPGVETAENQPRTLLGGLDGGKDQTIALEPDFDWRRAEQGGLAKPLGTDREKGV